MFIIITIRHGALASRCLASSLSFVRSFVVFVSPLRIRRCSVVRHHRRRRRRRRRRWFVRCSSSVLHSFRSSSSSSLSSLLFVRLFVRSFVRFVRLFARLYVRLFARSFDIQRSVRNSGRDPIDPVLPHCLLVLWSLRFVVRSSFCFVHFENKFDSFNC